MGKQLDPDNFLCQRPFSIRVVDQDWVNARAAEIAKTNGVAEPDVQSALMEVVDRVEQRAAWNYDQEKPILVYAPSGDQDPYVVAVPLVRHRNKNHVRTTPAANHNPGAVHAEAAQTLKEEFENLIFEREQGLDPADLAVDDRGHYVNRYVAALYEGFRMYHGKLVSLKGANFRENYEKSLGRYVIAKVNNAGVSLFVPAPFRHRTKALAMEEANRLATNTSHAFGVFRCLDIVLPPIEEQTEDKDSQ